MKTDYAKNRSRKRSAPQRGRTPTAARTSIWKGLLAGMVLGLIVAIGFYAYQQGILQQKIAAFFPQQSLQTITTVIKHHIPIAPATPAPPPQFTFYTVLPHGGFEPVTPSNNQIARTEFSTPQKAATTSPLAAKTAQPVTSLAVETHQLVQAPVVAGRSRASTTTGQINTKPPVEKSAANKSRYILQIASFHGANEADRLKAELILQGFPVIVVINKSGGQTWYRLLLGPYTSLQTAQNDQNRLQQNKIKSLLRRG